MDCRLEELTKAIIARHLGTCSERVELTHRLRRDYRFDNLTLVAVALDLEELPELGHGEFPFASLEHVDTVSDLVNLVSRLAKVRGGAGKQAAHALSA
jgi:acyl carrier protein